MTHSSIYSFSYEYLLKISNEIVSKEEVDDFINNPDVTSCDSIEKAYEMLLIILQDFQMYPNVINFRARSEDIKAKIRFPDVSYCANMDPKELAEYFIEKYNANGKRLWNNYCRSIITGATFLCKFEDYSEFKKTFDEFDTNDLTREAFALYLQTKIFNMGFALACNWLKELGYNNYPKPDVHMKDVCEALGLIDSNKTDIDCFEAMTKVARECNVDPYKLDKVWWLICSGNYYRYDKKLPHPQSNKEEFIKLLNSFKNEG